MWAKAIDGSATVTKMMGFFYFIAFFRLQLITVDANSESHGNRMSHSLLPTATKSIQSLGENSTFYVPCWLIHLHHKAHWSMFIMIWLWTSWPRRHCVCLVISRKVLYPHSHFPDLLICKYLLLSISGSTICMWLLPIALETSRMTLFHFGFALHWQKSPLSYHLLTSDPANLWYTTLVLTQFEKHKCLLATGMKWFTFIVFVHL